MCDDQAQQNNARPYCDEKTALKVTLICDRTDNNRDYRPTNGRHPKECADGATVDFDRKMAQQNGHEIREERSVKQTSDDDQREHNRAIAAVNNSQQDRDR